MNPTTKRIGVTAITENLLKRKWSAVILRHLCNGKTDPVEISKIEPDISPKNMNERLRAMVRYGLVARYRRPAPSSVIEYRPTVLGQKILEMIDTINTLDRELRQNMLARDQAHDEARDDARFEGNGVSSIVTGRAIGARSTV
jgi:DNA-binding HxlR family transcriptional regulator